MIRATSYTSPHEFPKNVVRETGAFRRTAGRESEGTPLPAADASHPSERARLIRCFASTESVISGAELGSETA